MSTSTTGLVDFGIIPIPDGVDAAGALRLSLVIAQSPARGTGTALALDDLPARIAACCGAGAASAEATGLHLAFYDDTGDRQFRVSGIVAQVHHAMRLGAVADSAAAAWRALFPGDELTTLYRALTATPSVAPPPPAPGRTRHYQAAQIVTEFSQLRSGAIGPTLRARLIEREKCPDWRVKGAVPAAGQTKIYANARAPFRFIFERGMHNAAAPGFASATTSVKGELPIRALIPSSTIGEIYESLRQRRMSSAIDAMGDNAGSTGKAAQPVDEFFNIPAPVRELMLDSLLLDVPLDPLLAATYLPGGLRGEPDAQRIAQRHRLDLNLMHAQFAGAFGPARGVSAEARRAGASALQAAPAPGRALDDVKAKFDGLLAHPTLAKLLNLIVDITVPDTAALAPKGFLQVWFDGGEQNAPLVAYVLERDSARPCSFRPGARSDGYRRSAPPTVGELGLPLAHGMVTLAQPRFSLSSTDVHAIVNATQVKLNELGAAQVTTAGDSDVSARVVEARSRGIQLLDDDAHRFVLANLLAQNDSDSDIYAETLVTGYRVLARRTPPHGAARFWRSLMARSVRYDPVQARYAPRPGEALPAWLPYDDGQEREHGAVRPLPRHDMEEDGKITAVAPSHVFTWFGDSLGVPAPQYQHPADNPVDQRPVERLRIGFGLEYDYPHGRDYLLPALRVGSAYAFALTPVYLHGGGPTLAEARALLERYPELALGAPGDAEPGFLFGREGDVQAPVVLLPPHDPLVTGRRTPPNEQVDRLVLRSGAGEVTERAVRYLAPPRIDFSIAEQYGVFDATDDAAPFGGMGPFDQEQTTGDFAHIERPGSDGKVQRLYVLRPARHAGVPDVAYFPDPAARNLGLAFERDDASPEGFPDLLPPMAFWPARPDDARASLDARPVRLTLRRWSSARTGARVQRSDSGGERDDDGAVDLPSIGIELAPAEQVTLWTWCWPDLSDLLRARPQLRWPLARNFALAATVLTKRWTDAQAAALAAIQRDPAFRLGERASDAHMCVSDYFSAYRLERALLALTGAAAAEVIPPDPALVAEVMATIESALFRRLPLNGVNGWHRLELVHAVARPRDVPSIARDSHGRLEFQPLRLLPGVSVANWIAANHDRLPPAGHQYGGTRLFFAGRIHIDRASTRSLRVEASWPLLDHALAIVDTAAAGQDVRRYVDRPPRVDRVLFDLRDIPRDGGANGAAVIDLLRDEVGRLRELASQSDSGGGAATAARTLNLRLVATSRFSDYFEPEPKDRAASTPGKFEVASRPFHGGDGAAAAAPDERHYEVTVPATVRPPPPVVTRIEWIAPERRERIGADHLRVTKHYAPRLYLDNSMRVSGEHELIAIAFLPAGAIVDHAYSPATPVPALMTGPFDASTRMHARFADEFARFVARPAGVGMFPKAVCQPTETTPLCAGPGAAQLAYVTRWGGDPTTAPLGHLDAVLSPARFSGHVAAAASVPMPLPDTQADAAGPQRSLTVGVLLYRPQLDAQTGNWYVDIGIDPGAAHAPFVRLALARYQPYALRTADYDLGLSTPLLLDPFRVPAPRTVEVLHARGRPVVASVYGVGYRRREPFGVADTVRHLTDMPLQNIELMRTTPGAAGALLQAYDLRGAALRCERVQPTLSGPLLHWRSEFTLPPTPSPQRYALVIDEVDMHIPDAVLDRSTTPGVAPPVTPHDLVARPAFFSLTVALDD